MDFYIGYYVIKINEIVSWGLLWYYVYYGGVVCGMEIYGNLLWWVVVIGYIGIGFCYVECWLYCICV